MVAAIAGSLLVVVWLWPRVEIGRRPSPRAAWIGIEVADSGLAEIGPVEIAAGSPFRLHAVLEAEEPDGTTVYFTEAPGLSLAGQLVPATAVKRWPERWDAKLLWFTVEGSVPFLALEPGEGLKRFQFEEFFRPEWGRVWSVDGDLESTNDDQLESAGADERRTFGTLRYQVWIELFDDDNPLVPEQRVKSWGAAELPEHVDRFPAVVALLEGPAAPASRVFGLTQVDPPPDADTAFVEQLTALADDGLAFSRLTVLRDQLVAAERSLDTLEWQRVDLSDTVRWGEQVAAGDLLRVGARFVVLYRDAGRPGLLDSEDLCFDFDAGATILTIGDVFVGSGDVEWASLAREPR